MSKKSLNSDSVEMQIKNTANYQYAPLSERKDYLVVHGAPFEGPGDAPEVLVRRAFDGLEVLADNYGNLLIGRQLITFEHSDGGRVYSLTPTQADELSAQIVTFAQAVKKKGHWQDGVIPVTNHMESPLERLVHQFECAECQDSGSPQPYIPVGKSNSKTR